MIRSLDQLASLRQEAQEGLKLREGGQGTRVIIGMGTCGIAAGAREVMLAILDEMKERGLAGVAVTQTGCAGICEYEPLVEVVKSGRNKVTYHHVDAEKARQIVAKHLVNDQPIGEWAIVDAKM